MYIGRHPPEENHSLKSNMHESYMTEQTFHQVKITLSDRCRVPCDGAYMTLALTSMEHGPQICCYKDAAEVWMQRLICCCCVELAASFVPCDFLFVMYVL